MEKEKIEINSKEENKNKKGFFNFIKKLFLKKSNLNQINNKAISKPEIKVI